MYVTDRVMLPISYVIENSTSVDYKQTTANFRRISYIRYLPFELKSERGKPEFKAQLLGAESVHLRYGHIFFLCGHARSR